MPKLWSCHMILTDNFKLDLLTDLQQVKVCVCIFRPSLTSFLPLPDLVGLLAAQVLDLSLDTLSTFVLLQRKKKGNFKIPSAHAAFFTLPCASSTPPPLPLGPTPIPSRPIWKIICLRSAGELEVRSNTLAMTSSHTLEGQLEKQRRVLYFNQVWEKETQATPGLDMTARVWASAAAAAISSVWGSSSSACVHTLLNHCFLRLQRGSDQMHRNVHAWK